MLKIEINKRLEGLNNFIGATNHNRYAGAAMKKKQQEIISRAIIASGAQHISEPVTIDYIWREKNKRRDKDNIAFAKKFIQDALVDCGVLDNDGWKQIVSFSDSFVVSDTAGVTVIIKPVLKGQAAKDCLKKTQDLSQILKQQATPSEEDLQEYFESLKDTISVIENIDDTTVKQAAALRYLHFKTWSEINKILYCEYGSSDTPRKAVDYYFKKEQKC